VITQFVLAGGDEIADYNGEGVGAPWMLTVRGVGGLPVAAITPATSGQTESVAYYHHDVLGSTVAATQAGTSGAAEVYVYSEFGEPAGGSFLPYQFAVYRYDNETGPPGAGANCSSPSAVWKSAEKFAADDSPPASSVSSLRCRWPSNRCANCAGWS
jgi:hypothetical protein